MRFESEQQLNMKLHEEVRDIKAQLNYSEATMESHVKQKERAQQ
jgi:hypothetical protein